MCGICGAIQIEGEPRTVLPVETLERMTDVMTHRGPNDRGTYAAPGIALGVRRLSIVDVEGGHQPVSNEDGSIWAVQNGELYNHLELRTRFESDGHAYRSRCDTEIIPHLYEHAGPAFVEQLRGKFAIAVWDERRRRAVIARDRLGIKPLYFARAGDLLLFASELKSILASGLVDAELDYEAIDAYLTFGFIPSPHTPLAQVSKLLPGHRLVVENGTVRNERYWAYPRPNGGSDGLTTEERSHRLLELLEESVKLRLMSDVPLGAMLSGGLDSSLIVALMARNMSEPVKTFSVGFREDELNELADARFVSELFGTEHHELELSITDQELNLEQLVWHLDEPLADLSAVGFLALSELAADHVTVALSGQGADELLGGYTRYRTAALAERWRSVPRPLRRGGEFAALRGPERARRAARMLSIEDSTERIRAAYDAESAAGRLRLAGGPLDARSDAAPRRVIESKLDGFCGGPLAELLFVDAQLGLVDDMLHYFDRASMAHSLEVRVPFLDHHLVEFCARVPNNEKVRRLTTKYLLKEASRGILPERIVDKKKIGFFHGVVEQWIAEQTPRAASQYLLQGGSRYSEFLDADRVAGLVAEQAATRGYSSSHMVFKILMLEVWLSAFLPAALRPAARSFD